MQAVAAAAASNPGCIGFPFTPVCLGPPARPPAPTHLTLFSACCGLGSRSRRLGSGRSLASQSGSAATAAATAAASADGVAPPLVAIGVRAGELAAESGAGIAFRLPERRMGSPVPPPPAPAAADAPGPPLSFSNATKPVRSTLCPLLWLLPML